MSEPVAIAELATAQDNLPIETGDFHENLFSDDEDRPQNEAAATTTILREDDMVIEEDDQTNYNKDKPNEGDEAGDNVEGSGKEDSDDEKAKAKKKTRSKSKRPKLDAVRLLNDKTGLPYLAETFPKYVKFKHGRGYESHNLRLLLDSYDQWMDRLMPSMSLSDVVDTIERLGRKAAVKEYLLKLRVEKCLEQEQLTIQQQKELQDVEAADEYFDKQPDHDSEPGSPTEGLEMEPAKGLETDEDMETRNTTTTGKRGQTSKTTLMTPDKGEGNEATAELGSSSKQAAELGSGSKPVDALQPKDTLQTEKDLEETETTEVRVKAPPAHQSSTSNPGLVDEIEAMLAEASEFQESLQ
eukprot:m.22067 g.22067  ORF g.22067 m.22067 type:complete len:355 (+) comp11196_c0_seq2:21-1085(+)